MLEILLLYGLCKSMGNVMRAKGRSPLLLQILVVLAWFGGEFCGFVGYIAFQSIQGTGLGEGFDLIGYVAALVGAALGVGSVFLIANLIPAANVQPQPVGAYGPYGNDPYGMQPPTDPHNPYNPYGDPRA